MGYADAGEYSSGLDGDNLIDMMEILEEMVPRGWIVMLWWFVCVKCWRTSSPHRSDLSYSADLYTKRSTLDGPGMARVIGLA